MTSRQRVINLSIAAVIAIVAVVVLLVTSGGSSSGDKDKGAATPASTPGQTQAEPGATTAPSKPEVTAIEVKNGKVVGGIAKLRVKQGDRVRFTVTADVSDEVHVHAYDFMKDVAPGKPVSFDFPATITGISEVELEAAGLQIASLRVDQ